MHKLDINSKNEPQFEISSRNEAQNANANRIRKKLLEMNYKSINFPIQKTKKKSHSNKIRQNSDNRNWHIINKIHPLSINQH